MTTTLPPAGGIFLHADALRAPSRRGCTLPKGLRGGGGWRCSGAKTHCSPGGSGVRLVSSYKEPTGIFQGSFLLMPNRVSEMPLTTRRAKDEV